LRLGQPVEDLAGGLESFEFAEGAVEGALVMAAVADEAVELVGLIGEVLEGLGFEGFEAAEVPAGGEEVVEEGEFEGAGGLDLGAVALFEFGEGLFFVVAQQQAAGEVVPVGVEAGGGFACVRAGSSGVLGVLPAGGLLGCGAHKSILPAGVVIRGWVSFGKCIGLCELSEFAFVVNGPGHPLPYGQGS